MTLVLASVNSDAAVMVADCLVSRGTRPVDDEVTKITLITFEDARLAMSFTGLASVGVAKGRRGPALAGTFRTVEWLGDTLLDLGRTHGTMIPTLVALKERLTAEFPPLDLAVADRLLVLGFVGYRYSEGRSIKVVATLGNSSIVNGRYVGKASFDLAIEEVEGAGLLALGRDRAIVEASRLGLARLIEERRPPHGIAEKATEVIREAARQPASGGAIGELCMSVIVYAAPSSTPVSRHHADKPSGIVFLPHAVNVAAGGAFVLDPSISGGLPGEVPRSIVFPTVPRNAPCPCGSGRKYKRCHGRRL